MLVEPSAPRDTNTVRRGFEDGLGRRYRPAARLDSEAPLEILCFRHEITDVPAFDFALRERVARLSDLHAPLVCAASGRSTGSTTSEAPWCSCPMASPASGSSSSCRMSSATGQTLDLNAALSSRSATPVGHRGAAPEGARRARCYRARASVRHSEWAIARRRIRVGRSARAAEVFARALLERASRGAADGRRAGAIRRASRPCAGQAWSRSPSFWAGRFATTSILDRSRTWWHRPPPRGLPTASSEPLPSALREWLNRVLQLDKRHSYPSVVEAEAALDQLLSDHATYNAQPDSLEAFMERLHNPAIAPKAPEPPQIAANRTSDFSTSETPCRRRRLHRPKCRMKGHRNSMTKRKR